MTGEDAAAAPVTLVDLVERLVEPGPPAPVSMAPRTVGWVVLAGFVALALLWLLWRAFRRWRANAYRRAGLAALAAAGDDPVAIAPILRRVALAAWPRGQVADLADLDWLAFLDRTGGSGGFVDGPGAALATAPYSRAPADLVPGLGDLAARRVRHHRAAVETGR